MFTNCGCLQQKSSPNASRKCIRGCLSLDYQAFSRLELSNSRCVLNRPAFRLIENVRLFLRCKLDGASNGFEIFGLRCLEGLGSLRFCGVVGRLGNGIIEIPKLELLGGSDLSLGRSLGSGFYCTFVGGVVGVLVAFHFVPVTAREIGEFYRCAVVVERERAELSEGTPLCQVVNVHVEGQTVLEAVDHAGIHHVVHTAVTEFAAEFAEALSLADAAVVLDIYGAREQPHDGITSQLIIDRMTNKVVHQPNFSLVPQTVAELAHPGDMVITMGAGDVTVLADEILFQLRTDD